jgi:hypothetical protein
MRGFACMLAAWNEQQTLYTRHAIHNIDECASGYRKEHTVLYRL